MLLAVTVSLLCCSCREWVAERQGEGRLWTEMGGARRGTPGPRSLPARAQEEGQCVGWEPPGRHAAEELALPARAGVTLPGPPTCFTAAPRDGRTPWRPWIDNGFLWSRDTSFTATLGATEGHHRKDTGQRVGCPPASDSEGRSHTVLGPVIKAGVMTERRDGQ